MGTFFLRTNPSLGSASTSRYVSIPTSPATLLTLDSGYQALSLFNVGSATLIYGDSNISVNSGNFIYVGAAAEWLDLQDGWQVYLRADSVSTLISYVQYEV